MFKPFIKLTLFLVFLLIAVPCFANDYYQQKENTYTIKNFEFHTGQILPELKIHYVTLGDPKNEAVLILHGTTGSGEKMLTPNFGGELFKDGQVLDAKKYFIILPDAIGTGESSKPSDGLRTQFPQYNYDDMVKAQYLLLTEGLGINHLRLILGVSMGGMQTWLWGINHPDFMDGLVPTASMPTEMSGRNWMMRKFISESIRKDPDWQNGYYTTQPESAKFASVFYNIATNGGNQAMQKLAPTRAKADEVVSSRLSAPFTADANDILYQWESSGDYNPQNLEAIKAPVLAINSEDDERNPPELGIMEAKLKQIKQAKLYLIPASEETIGHSTTSQAKWYKSQLNDFLKTLPHK